LPLPFPITWPYLSISPYLPLSFFPSFLSLLAFTDINSRARQMATTFSRFRQLPPELRWKIWESALPGPRTVHLIKEPAGSIELNYRPRARCVATIPSPRIVTTLIQTCAESRIVTLRIFRTLFVAKSLEDTSFRLHFFNPSQDGIFVDDIWPWLHGSDNKPAALYSTKRLSISCNAWWSMWSRNNSRNSFLGKKGLLRFKYLDELNIIFRKLTDHERAKIMRVRILWSSFTIVFFIFILQKVAGPLMLLVERKFQLCSLEEAKLTSNFSIV
jgi:hypothetical protein